MILFSNCKINLGLRIVTKRADGYHNIETVMYPVEGLNDAVEIVKSDGRGVQFSSSGLATQCPEADNLCVRAYNALKNEVGQSLGGAKIHLHKVIPMGAGLGGGSADAAYVIKGLAEIYDLGLSVADMERVAASIGSDTSFFIRNEPSLATGRGEILEPVSVSLAGKSVLIVKPDVSVSTAEAYSAVEPCRQESSIKGLILQPIDSWRDTIFNDFERSVFAAHPCLAQIKSQMYEQGAIYAAMSGSGSAIFGIFDNNVELKLIAQRYKHEFVYHQQQG